jgi:transcriptional regulator with XRE-family HTH domain
MGGRARKVLARRLRALRLMRGWTQEELAEACGLHRTYVSMVERGQCNIGLDNLEKLADAFGLSLPEFFSMLDSKSFGKRMLVMLDKTLKRKEL